MYDYIKGLVTYVEPSSVTIENNNIGYLIKTPNPYQFKIGEQLTIFLYQHVREDLIELYGFKTINERMMFLKLINVKGLGPKGAMAILASSSVEDIISAINRLDADYFKHFPGIGVKCSQQIILDLKGKVDFTNSENETSEANKNLASALKALGYSATEIKSALKNFDINDYVDLGSAVKAALKKMTK